MRGRSPKVKPTSAPRWRSVSRVAASCAGEAPYLRARCSTASSPSAGICGFSSKGWKCSSTASCGPTRRSASSSEYRPTAHQGQATSETKSIFIEGALSAQQAGAEQRRAAAGAHAAAVGRFARAADRFFPQRSARARPSSRSATPASRRRPAAARGSMVRMRAGAIALWPGASTTRLAIMPASSWPTMWQWKTKRPDHDRVGEGNDHLHLAGHAVLRIGQVDHVAQVVGRLRLAVDRGHQEVELVDVEDMALAADVEQRPFLDVAQASR